MIFTDDFGIHLLQFERLSRNILEALKHPNVIRRVRNNLTVDAAELVYKSMILPKLDYCDFVWNNLSDTKYNQLERVQTRAARVVQKDSSHSDIEVKNQLGWKSLFSRSTTHRIIFVFKCLNCNVSKLFTDYFVQMNHAYQTRRNRVDLIAPKISTEISTEISAKKSMYYKGAILTLIVYQVM